MKGNICFRTYGAIHEDDMGKMIELSSIKS